MSSETTIARRYAAALAAHAAERNEIEKVREDLTALADLLDPYHGDFTLPELLDFLQTPAVTPEAKIKATDVMCEKLNIGETVGEFLNVLIRHNRVPMTALVAQEFDRLASQYESSRTAYVETAVPLDDTAESRLKAALAKATGSKVVLHVKVNKHLLGGAKVRLDDVVLDGTLTHRLRRLTARLA